MLLNGALTRLARSIGNVARWACLALAARGLVSLVLPEVAEGQVLNLAGAWDYTETADVTCIAEGEEFDPGGSGSGTVVVQQNGTGLAWNVPGLSIERTSTLDGHIVHVSGPFAVSLGGGATFTFSTNRFEGTGTVTANRDQISFTGSGSAAGTVCLGGECVPFSCTGTERGSFRRPLLTVLKSGSCGGTVTGPTGITCGSDCAEGFEKGSVVSFSAMPDANAVFAGWSGPCQGTGTCQLTVNGASTLGARFDCASPLVAAVLPGSRSVKTGTTATAFATIINSGANPTTSCSISLSTSLPASFLYQTTDPNTNALTRTPNTPVDIPARGFQTFLIALTANAAFAPTDAQFTFSCAGVPPARILSGLNTLLLSASTNLVADIVALAATSPDPSLIVDIPSANGTGAFAVATVNLGAAGPIVVSADTGGESLAVRLSICQTNPATAACLAPPSATVTTQINAEQTPTFSIFVAATGPVTFDPASNRVFVRFKEPGGATRGATSVAVRMQ